MSDLITSPLGQQMADPNAAQSAGPQQPPQPGLAQQATQQQQNAPIPQHQAAGSEQDPRPVGTQQQAQDASQQASGGDPTQEINATPEEQAQYTQLVTRFVLMISDMRKGASGKSPVDLALEQMNNPKLTVAQAVGQTTAQIMFILHNGAKMQKVQYDPDVLFHGADECIVATYLLGNARGIFKGTPPFKGLPADDGSYPFDTAEVNIIGHAKLYAVQKFGQLMMAHGQISTKERQDATDFWHQQIIREMKSNQVDPKVLKQLANAPGMQQGIHNQLTQTPSVDDGSGQQGVAPQQPPAAPPPAAAPPPPDQGQQAGGQ